MKKHNTVKVVLITILVFALLTWVFPAAYFQSEYVEQGRAQMGLFDLFNYPLTAMSYFGHIALFVLVVGGFYGILYKIPAYRTFLDKIVAKVSKKGLVFLAVTMFLLATITSMCGLQLGLFIFFPMLVSIILLMGYDKIVAALTLVGSTMVGVAGSTFAYQNTYIIFSVLSIEVTSEMVMKVVILLVGLVLLVLNTCLYIKKLGVAKSDARKAEKKVIKKAEVVEEKVVEVEVKDTKKANSKSKTQAKTNKTTKTTKNTKSTKNAKSSSKKSSKKDIKAAVKDDEVIVVKEQLDNDISDGFVPTVVDSSHKIWPLIVGFLIILIIMVMAFFPWYDVFQNEAFVNATAAVTEFELFGFPIFGKLLGTFNEFGAWQLNELIIVLAVIALLLVVIYNVKIDDLIDGFAEGAKKALAPAVIVILVYTCLVITTYHPFQLVIYKAILELTKGFNVFTSSLVAVLASLFNVEPVYSFQSILPYVASVITNNESYSIMALVYQSMYGLTMLVAPTSIVLMVTLSYLKISYKEWLSAVWKLVLELLVILLIIFTILVLV